MGKDAERYKKIGIDAKRCEKMEAILEDASFPVFQTGEYLSAGSPT